MSIWSKLFRRHREEALDEEPGADEPAESSSEPPKTVALPLEPFVFECQSCGKVFEARRKRPLCPECDSAEVSQLSE